MENGSSSDWYTRPLDGEDLFAGLFLIFFALVFAPLYAIVSFVMFKDDKDVIGFRYLCSASLADILLLFNYGVWPGLAILFKTEIVPVAARHWIQMYLDWCWFAMCYHYPVVAWSRFVAIKYPHSFRTQTRLKSYALCFCCYLLALIQVLTTHFQPWYVTFYYEPSAYGMHSEDLEKYRKQGHAYFFISFDVLMMVVPFVFYSWAFVLLIQHKRATSLKRQPSFAGTSLTPSNVESRLIIPCAINSVVFIIGQVLITIGTGEGKWATWSVMLLFCANSAVNPILLLCFSALISCRLATDTVSGSASQAGQCNTEPRRAVSTCDDGRITADRR